MGTLFDEFKACIDCRCVLLDSEVFVDNRCGRCALKAEPMTCLSCRGYGKIWPLARDRHQRRQPVECEACGGTGTKQYQAR